MKSIFKTYSDPAKKRFKAILTELGFWLVFILLLVFGIEWEQGKITDQVIELCIVFAPLIAGVYAHSFIFSRYFLNRKFIHYIILTSILLVVSYYGIKLIYQTFVPDNQSSVFGGIFLFILMHTGFRYLIIAPKQSLKIKEEEARRVKAERDLQELEAKQTKAELDFLKSQINPHFLFNSLNSIYSLTMDNPEKAGEAVLTLSDLLRYNLESSKIKYVPLSKEIEFIDNYIQLESLRLGDNCKIVFTKEGEFNTKAIAPLILIPFVENCFKHGISADKSNNNIYISIGYVDNNLTFTTENRIAISRMKHHPESIKIGIENVKRRLEMIYPNKHKLSLSSDNFTYKVLLQIEL